MRWDYCGGCRGHGEVFLWVDGGFLGEFGLLVRRWRLRDDRRRDGWVLVNDVGLDREVEGLLLGEVFLDHRRDLVLLARGWWRWNGIDLQGWWHQRGDVAGALLQIERGVGQFGFRIQVVEVHGGGFGGTRILKQLADVESWGQRGHSESWRKERLSRIERVEEGVFRDETRAGR